MKNWKPYIAALTLAGLVLSLGGCGKSKQQSYDSARNLYFYGQYSEARKAFKNLEDYQDSAAMVTACDYQLAMQQLADGEYLGASTAFAALGEYANSRGLSQAAAEMAALQQYEQGNTEEALKALAGTQIAKDLQSGHETKQEMMEVTGTWSMTLDALADLQAGLKELAGKQDKLDKKFAEAIPLKNMTAKVELRLEEDGLAAMILSDEDMDRLGKSYTTQVHDGLAEYYDGVVEDLADEMEISTDELMENYGVKDNAGVFEAENDMTMGEFEKKLAPTKVISDLQSLYNGSGVVVTGDEGIRIRFPDRTWEVDASQDGKLILTSDELRLTFMKNAEEQ